MQFSQPLRPRICVLLADSSPISSELLAEAIERDPRMELVAPSSKSTEIMERIRSYRPDVLLISAQLGEEPDRGLAVLEQLHREGIAPKAIVLLESRTPDLVVNAFRSGASGVFCRTMPLSLLCKCIVAVQEGQIWANSEELRFVLSALAAASRLEAHEGRRFAKLSRREREVVRRVIEGQSNSQIAEALRMSQDTVKNYISKIFEKSGVSSRVELVFQVLTQAQRSGGYEVFAEKSSEARAKERQRREGGRELPKPAALDPRLGKLA